MCKLCSAKYALMGGAIMLATASAPSATFTSIGGQTFDDQLQDLQSLSHLTVDIAVPEIEEPGWLREKKAAAAAARALQQEAGIVVQYSVTSRGVTSADLSEFSAQVNETLNDTRGWARLGVSFQEVDSGGSFVMVLSSADQMTSFSSGCSPLWSCRVGVNVIINQDRWLGATDAWNQAGGLLRDYRHAVVNHEVGHWLGHGHATCGGPGQPARVMQQQSIDLQGCTINPWPLASELWSAQLGVDKR